MRKTFIAFDQQTTAEYRAVGECLAGQVKTRGWVGPLREQEYLK